jgi:hypothetical protein
MHKYKAKPLYYDTLSLEIRQNPSNAERKSLLYFASQHEFKVYQALVSTFGAKSIVCQYKIDIAPKCSIYPKGKHWLVDFAVIEPLQKELLFLCEAKGEVLREFMYQLAFLELNNPKMFSLLYVIFSGETIAFKGLKRKVKGLFNDRLLTLKDAEECYLDYGKNAFNSDNSFAGHSR